MAAPWLVTSVPLLSVFCPSFYSPSYTFLFSFSFLAFLSFFFPFFPFSLSFHNPLFFLLFFPFLFLHVFFFPNPIPLFFTSEGVEMERNGWWKVKKGKRAMIVLWLIVFVVCCGECLGLCLLLLHSRSLSPCVSCHPCPCVTIPIPCVVVSVCVCVVRHVTCSVWWLALSNTLPCCAPSSLLFSFCPSLSSTTITRKNTQGVERREGERSGWGKRERKRKKRGVMQKRVEKGGAKREKEITTPGVPRLSPTLVLTRPEEA